uniref:Uncharacterized protein n=1 Tax=Panagrolaimus sp. ES5 TaxID=591445 RepID=A0AC34FK37_9BILA
MILIFLKIIADVEIYIKVFSNQRLFNFGINRGHPEDYHDTQPPLLHVNQNFDPTGADGAHFDLDVHRGNLFVPPFFTFERQQHDDHHRRCNTPPPLLAHFDHKQHNIFPAPPPGHATISSDAVNEYPNWCIFRTPHYYQLWDMERQQQDSQLAAGFVQTPPQLNHMDFKDYPGGQQTEADAHENLAENDILEGRVFHAQREIPRFNDFEVRVALGED